MKQKKSLAYQESIKGNWSSSGATEDTKECQGQHFSFKNRYCGRKVKELLKINMAVVIYGQHRVLNADNCNFFYTNVWKSLFRKMKTLH